MIHTICLQLQHSYLPPSGGALTKETVFRMLIAKTRQSLGYRLREKLLILCVDAIEGGLKFAVQNERAKTRDKWADSAFTRTLMDSSTRSELMCALIEDLTVTSIAKLGIIFIQRGPCPHSLINSTSSSHGVLRQCGVGWFHASNCRSDVAILAMLENSLVDTEDRLAYESDMLMFQVAEALAPLCVPILLETKDTDVIPIWLSRAARSTHHWDLLANVTVSLRAIARFRHDMDVSLYSAMCDAIPSTLSLPTRQPPVQVQVQPGRSGGEWSRLLTLFDWHEDGIGFEHVREPYDQVASVADAELLDRAVGILSTSGFRGPMARRCFVFLTRLDPASMTARLRSIAEFADGDVRGLWELVCREHEGKPGQDGFVLGDDVPDGATRDRRTQKNANPENSMVELGLWVRDLYARNLIRPLTRPGTQGAYAEYVLETAHTNKFRGKQLTLRPHFENCQENARVCAALIAWHGLDYVKGFPHVGERQLRMCMVAETAFWEAGRLVCAMTPSDRDVNRLVNSVEEGEDDGSVTAPNWTVISPYFESVEQRAALDRINCFWATWSGPEDQRANVARNLTVHERIWSDDHFYAALVNGLVDLKKVAVDPETHECLDLRLFFQKSGPTLKAAGLEEMVDGSRRVVLNTETDSSTWSISDLQNYQNGQREELRKDPAFSDLAIAIKTWNPRAAISAAPLLQAEKKVRTAVGRRGTTTGANGSNRGKKRTCPA